MSISGAKERGQDIADRVGGEVKDVRRRHRYVDQLIRSLQHYGQVLGNQLAGAVTYFGFLSFFPIIALAFATVGYIVAYVPEAEAAVEQAIQSVLPGMVGTDPGQINVDSIADARAGVGLIGLVVLLYSGLGWLSALRGSLQAVFSDVVVKKRNFIVGKAIDLVVLGILGVILTLSVALSTAVGAFTREVIAWIGLTDAPGTSWLLRLAVVLVGIAANTVLFYAMYQLLPKHRASKRALWEGALIAGVGFEVLKQLANLVISGVTENALYGAFAIMVALLVWINYFARLTVLGACWAAVGAVMADEAAGDQVEPGEDLGRGARVIVGVASAAAVAVMFWRRGLRRAS